MAFIFLLSIQFPLTNNPELTLMHSPITTEGKRAEEFQPTYAYDNHLTSVDIEDLVSTFGLQNHLKSAIFHT